MENASLTRHSPIKPENIDIHHLMPSLLSEGIRTGILTEAKVEKIQVQLMAQLSEAITQYTQNESSSVRTETAQSILQSLLYCIDICLREFPSLELSMEALQESSISDLFTQGLKKANGYLEQAKQLLQEVQSTRLPVNLIAYNDTIEKSFSVFFYTYDARFDAHNTTASIDYPLLSDDTSWNGVIYIKQYLEHLLLENKLCSHFTPGDIDMLIKVNGQKYRSDGSELLVNISELILRNALCSVLIGRRADALSINQADVGLLEIRLQRLTEQQFPELLQRAMRVILIQLDITEPAEQQYFNSLTDAFCPQLANAFQENSLAGLFVLSEEARSASAYYYEAGEKLTDEQLRTVIDLLLECPDTEKKADLIESEIHNIEDLVEVFGTYAVYGSEEYSVIFNRMGDYELAILLSGLLDDSPFANQEVLAVENWRGADSELCWQEKLIHYLEAGDINRYKKILQLAKELQDAR